MPLTWVATEMRTGAVIETLKDLSVDSVKDTIGQYETAQGSLPLSSAPASWLRATKPGATVLNLIDTDHNVCVWGGFITQRVRTEGDEVQIALSTIPAYFYRRYVGAKSYASTDQNSIVTDLVNSYAAAGSNGGIPIRVQVVGGAGTPRSRTYLDSDDKTLYDVLQELMQVDGGPEWYVGWESGSLSGGRQTWTPVFFVGSRIGNAAPVGMSPNVIPELPGTAQTVTYTEDYSLDSGANDVLAVSDPTGSGVRPQSSHHVYADPDRPTFEKRFTPSTSITSTDTLDSHATDELNAQRDGEVTANLAFLSRVGTALGVDWSIGDDIGYRLGSPDDPSRAVPAFPGGTFGTERAWGWQLTLSDPPLVTPVLMTGDADA